MTPSCVEQPREVRVYRACTGACAVRVLRVQGTLLHLHPPRAYCVLRMRCARAVHALCTRCAHTCRTLLLEQPQYALPQRALGAEQRGVAHNVEAEARAGECIDDTAVDAEHADGPRVVGAHKRQKYEVALLARKLLDRRHVHLRRRAAAATATATATAAAATATATAAAAAAAAAAATAAAAAAARARARALLVPLAPDQQLLAAVWCEDGELRGSVALPQKVRGERRDEAGLVWVGARLSLGL